MHIPFSITFGKQPLIKFKGFSNIRQSIIIPSPSQTLYFIQCSSIIKFKTQKKSVEFQHREIRRIFNLHKFRQSRHQQTNQKFAPFKIRRSRLDSSANVMETAHCARISKSF